MNRLGFGDFHAAHFSPQQVEQWKHLLRKDLYPSWQPYQQEQEYPPEPMNDTMEEETDQHVIQDDQDPLHGLSKEAIEIFRFSEAYRKEREATEREQGGEEDEESTFDDEPYMCNGLHKGGIETPANRLIHVDMEAKYCEQVALQERFLDAEYIKTCQTKDSPVVLWPVVPLR